MKKDKQKKYERFKPAGFYAFEKFKEKRVLVIVPHEDDEICIMGGILGILAQNGAGIKLLFVTDGDYKYSSKVRRREAVHAAKVMGISPESMVFLGYHDTPNWHRQHVYYDEIDHRTRENLINDILQVLLQFQPDYIFANDLDDHVDHRAVSLVSEYAVGEALRKMPGYQPQIFKAFAYSTSFYAKPDYRGVNLGDTDTADRGCLNHPVYKWDERLRMPVERKSRTRWILNNIVYKGMFRHVSQNGIKFAPAIANADQVYWCRNTDSLFRKGRDYSISVSSGNADRLSDFLYFEPDDIRLEKGVDLSYVTGLWIPDADDNQKRLSIKFHTPSFIRSLRIVQNPDFSHHIDRIAMIINGMEERIVRLSCDQTVEEIPFDERIAVCEISLIVLETRGMNAGIGEIEIYGHKEPEIWFAKIVCGSRFVYDLVYGSFQSEALYREKLPEMDLIAYDTDGKIIHNDQLQIEWFIKNGSHILTVNRDDLDTVFGKDYEIMARADYRHKCVTDVITVKRVGKIYDSVIDHLNHVTFVLLTFMNRVKNKLIRMKEGVR